MMNVSLMTATTNVSMMNATTFLDINFTSTTNDTTDLLLLNASSLLDNNETDTTTNSTTNSTITLDDLLPWSDVPSIAPSEEAIPSSLPTFTPTIKPTWAPPPPANETDTSVGRIESTDTSVLGSTIRVYGFLYLILLALFCCLRLRFNRYFNVRSWVPELECDIAKKSNYGLINWMWKVFQVNEDDILEQCGMDALCFIRVLRMGRNLAVVGCIQACWLIPTYATAEDSDETWYLKDPLVLISTAHLPIGSPRFLATVISAYICFGYAMWLIKQELQWYTNKRHKFLSQRRPRNYAIYVSGIPPDLRSGSQLEEFFRQSGATSSVLEAVVYMACPRLESLVSRRKDIKRRLARAKAFEQIHRRRKTRARLNYQGCLSWWRWCSRNNSNNMSYSNPNQYHRSNTLVEKIDSVEFLEMKLRQLTKDIAIAYQKVERSNDPYSLDQHRDMVMEEIEEMRRAERAQNIASRERVNSFHDMDQVEEICHYGEDEDQQEQEEVVNNVNSGDLTVSDKFARVAESFFFGELSKVKDQHQHQRQSLLNYSQSEEEDTHLGNDEEEKCRVTIRSAHNQVRYMSWSESEDEFEDDEAWAGGEEKKLQPHPRSRFHSSSAPPKLVDSTFPSKSTISTVPGTFDDNKPQQKAAPSKKSSWIGFGRKTRHRKRGNQPNDDNDDGDDDPIGMVSFHHPSTAAADSGVSSDDDDDNDDSESSSEEDSGYAKICAAIRRKSGKGEDDDDDGISCDSDSDSDDSDMYSSGRSWSTKTTSVIRRVSQVIKTEVVGKGVVEVGAGVGKVTKNTLKLAGDIGDLGISNIIQVGELGVRNVNRFGWQAAEIGVENIKTIRQSAAAVVPVVLSHEEGKALEAGFVVFKDLYSRQAALQMLHHSEAGVMQVEEAPGPDEIFWRNVGLPGNAKRSGRLLSLTSTCVLCLFWTVPISFISALTEVNSLKENVPVVAGWVEEYPSSENILALIAPLLLLILQDLVLPEFLKYFAAWEGHVSVSTLESAVFVKYAAFVLVQTFFISAISGSISAELGNMLNEPDQFVDFLANALPAQSNYFLQILVVSMAVKTGLELLRVLPLGMAFLRRFIGPNLTQEEKRKHWKFFTPLEDPRSFEHANVSGSVVLYFMVFFVYCCLAPVSCFFLLIMFALMESGYRYNFYHNYPPTPDSGGKHWKGFFHILLACMIVAQLTIVGFLVLKNSLYAIPFLVPLLIISILFILYLNIYQLPAADHLPTSDCVAIDRRHRLRDFTFAYGKYVQPCIQEAQSEEIFDLI